MYDITKAEMETIITLVKSPEIDYNGNNLAKKINITPAGALKILKRLEKESILKSKKVGKAVIYKINTEDSYAHSHVSLILSRERLYAAPRIKRWVRELEKIKNAEIIILFGSVLRQENYNDIDVVLVTEQKRFKNLQKEIKEINNINVKRIHPVYQSLPDLKNNIKKKNPVMLNAIKGIIIKGEAKFLEVYNESF